MKTDEEKHNHSPAEKIRRDHGLAGAITGKIKDEHYGPYAARASFQMDGWPTGTRLGAKMIYRYVAKGMAFGITTADLPGGENGGKRAGNRLRTAVSEP
jgi:hypothetical protein